MSETRKSDHLDLTFKSRTTESVDLMDLHYEPLLSAHPNQNISYKFLNFEFGLPLWISSMTGGTKEAYTINQNLARVCHDFNIGMGLGSCRPLLESDQRIKDFAIRKQMGESAPLFTNFGIAQIEELLEQGELLKIVELTKKLEANGIIIHINPLQEWAQPEGDRFKHAPIETLKRVCDQVDLPIIVKEVGQGMGPLSLAALSKLPIAAIELAGFGGTNFTYMEQLRDSDIKFTNNFSRIGHTAKEMISWLNSINTNKEIIISGGITDPINAHVLISSYKGNAISGMAGQILKYARGDYELLYNYVKNLEEQFAMAKMYIKGE